MPQEIKVANQGFQVVARFFGGGVFKAAQFKKWAGGMPSTTIGMKVWLTPQISEHCPKYRPGRDRKAVIWFVRPGIASAFKPMLGTAHLWITSVAVTRIRISVWVGRIARWSTSSRRNVPGTKSELGIIYESKVRESNSGYS
jgi:hypothetical protein